MAEWSKALHLGSFFARGEGAIVVARGVEGFEDFVTVTRVKSAFRNRGVARVLRSWLGGVVGCLRVGVPHSARRRIRV